METWPATLPNPSPAFSAMLKGSVARSARKDAGVVLQRRRFTAEQRYLRAEWLMDDAQYAEFQTFVLYTLNGGADQFTISLPTGGEGLKAVPAKLEKGAYYVTNVGVLTFRVSAKLIVEANDVWSEETYDTLALIGTAEAIEAAADALHILVHTTLPTYFI